ncbi:GBS Bsp-like repeat-containing protein [Streptococcus constellatus]|uniref:Lysozyme n=1 Tax=Streptococcus constellatus subsp. constellatus SK53 TaxID=1095730 RepID=A0AAD2Y4E4_STRCV|nr:GBS Bsp-like repeat-containing protein [Streptococcus constellatus]EID22068.1 GBS Bsp-like repeat protein [Streptococcus constellatus subsp. constellatus SK53]MDP1484543.1 GBS Bsp-like repeat-containing protein [Streptococcus constellatus]QQT06257.1 GBS Bsp-like repeat-containing protein [Streptococcus constellatus]SUN40843.1 N-acetylmuramidase [Streptococcus constellatus]BBD22924.1 N-acetylmuramidase [Streptococcus constellatus subsp. constellatus]
MRKKSLFYLTSTAILIAASSHQVFAAESVKASTSETTVELNKQEADSSPKFQTKEATHTSPVNQVTSSSSSENEVTDSSTALTEAKASKEKSVVKENPVVANETKKDNKSTFFAAQNNQATARSNTDAQVKKSTFVDVSSHNGHISKEDYQRLAEKGVSGVVVKLTEGTSYKNPYAISQAQNAQAAGMQVSAYAFSHYTNEAEARAEARYFAEEARRLNLPSSTVMVNDIEDSDMLSNINTSTQAWADEMRRMGFSNLMYYTSASWLDRNNLRTKGPIQTERFGLENFWVAQYPTSKLSADDAKTLKYNSEAGAWQFTSQAELLPGRHVFDQSVDYTGRFTGNAPIAKDALSGTITIANNNPETGTFDVIVSNVGAPYGVREVKVPIWSSVNGQDDIIWYTAARQSDGTYKVTVKASNHKNSVGEYNIHLYYVQNDGQLIGVTGTKTTVSIGKPKGTITIQNNNPNTGTFDVIVSGVSNPAGGVKTVSVPIWSSVNGQDDIIWYTAARQSDGTYKVTVKASNHKNSVGEYNIHLYYVQNDGQLIGVGGTKTNVSIAKPQGKITIANNNPETGTFDVIVSEVSNPAGGVKTVSVPVWSSDGGQDDIIWYTAARQADGTYKVTVKATDHKRSTGEYNIHLYYVQHDGQLVGVTGTTTTVSMARPKGTLTITNNNPNAGTFDVIVSGVSSPDGVREVKLPTWSNVDGQDDIIWYTAKKQADGTYKVTVKASDHKYSTGIYNVHLYYVQDDGKLVGVAGTQTVVSLAKPQGQITIQNNNPDTGTFDVIVSNVSNPYGVREVKLPIWSSVNGQDDIIWYTAAKQANGTYKVTVKASNHKNSVGEYNIHLYYIQNNGKLVGVTGTKTNVSIAKPQGKITIANNNPDTGTFDVIVSEVSNPAGGVKAVSVPIWSSVNGQDDIIWYTATKQVNGTYKVTVKASDHKYSTGLYYVHLYYVQNNGTLIGVGGTSTNVTISPDKLKPTGKITIQNNNPNTGTFEVVVSNVFSPNGVREVKLPTWSSVNGQDDVSWYTATKQADGTYKLFVNASNHKNSTGEYNVHLYYVQNDGQLVGVGGIKLQVNKRVYETPYYSQRDSRWAGRTYGGYTFAATGCVPTTVAMAISGITGQTVLPTTVADYLYHSTNEFNKRSYGTTSHGIVLAARHWGLKTETLGSTAAVREALAMGHHVLGAVGTSVFANYPVTHELIMKGYNNGMTYVMDPYNASNNGYYSVDYLFRVRSLDPTDNTEGSPFMTIRA